MRFSFDESLSTAREVIDEYSSEEYCQSKACSSSEIPENILDDCLRSDAPTNSWSMNSNDYEIGQAIGTTLIDPRLWFFSDCVSCYIQTNGSAFGDKNARLRSLRYSESRYAVGGVKTRNFSYVAF